MFFNSFLNAQELWPEMIEYTNDVRFDNIDSALTNKKKDVILALVAYTPRDIKVSENDLNRLTKINRLMALFIDLQKIDYLPKSFRKNKLKYLSIRYTNIAEFPAKQISKSLETFRFEHNRITNIQGIGKLKNLKYLNLEGNFIDSLGEELYQLDSLEYLYLGGNPLKNSTIDICKFKNLKLIFINYTEMKKLPLGLNCLDSLDRLDISNSSITFTSKELEGVKLAYFHFTDYQLLDDISNLRKALGNNCRIRCEDEYGYIIEVPLLEDK